MAKKNCCKKTHKQKRKIFIFLNQNRFQKKQKKNNIKYSNWNEEEIKLL